MRYDLMPIRMAIIQKSPITSVGENVEKRETSCIIDGIIYWCSQYENWYEVSQNIKNRIIL